MTTEKNTPEIMTVLQYMTNGACKCPVCHSEEIEGGPIEIDAGQAWQPMSCNACPATWNDVYKLTGFSELKEN